MNLSVKFVVLFVAVIAGAINSSFNSSFSINHSEHISDYKTSAPIRYTNKSDITLENLSIDCSNQKIAGIQLHYCSNVHIKNCKIYNSLFYGIKLFNCTNVTIENCFITNVQAGVYAQQSKIIKVNNNQFLNMNGPFPSGNFIQFDNVNGGGNQMNYNKCEDIAGVAQHPQDGLPGDSIQVIGNWIRGGQISHDSGGATGIGLGDNGGSYQVARYNILVNPGYVGIQPQGGIHIKVDHNTIYSSRTPVSLIGLSRGNASGKPSSDVYIGYNTVNWTDYNGHSARSNCAWYDPAADAPLGWETNKLAAPVDSSILPAKIINMK
jgi:parallel beta-helix repeat protein